ncbi:serine/threonine-protein phosphatase 7 long form homolog isoform X4 [Quercus robur]|uniref:serine/threonine-protein phosphatase 7 long form homolog isoform X4 n=1 Tax=Quercus robur TaxID=38942 RepID=UPI0021617BA1|nr:serine/threonine-protein phosphatase 7 long form homolog isoform X4 [Quercus robur]
MEPRIDEELKILHLGLLQRSLLTRQPYHRSEAIWNGEEPGPLMCRSRTKEMANVQMQDNRVIDIIKLLRLEGLFRVTSREIDHCLITALVERSRPETHTFHLPHGEMSIILQDVEVIFGLPIDGEVLVGLTTVEDGDWSQVCGELLGFTPPNDNKTLVGQRILISRLVEAIATPLPHDATEIQIHQYARCYILALVEDKLFMDKSGDRVHLMFLDFMRNLRDPRQYSWGSGCLAWLYRELCRASEKGASQIGGACTLVQYWAWVRLPFLCSRIEPPLGCDYGLWPYAPLAFKWVRVPSSKSRPSNMALVHYREQLVTMQLDQDKSSAQLDTVGAFQKLPMVMPSVDILYSALKKAKRVSPTKGIPNIAKRERNRGTKQLDALMKEIAVPLRTYLENFPKKKYLHPYERSLIELTLGDGNYEEVLGKVNSLRKNVVSVGKKHASLCAKSLTKREAEERLSETLRAMPVVDLETPTLCLVGAPNVGKSSLVRILSTGKPEIYNYPFTTRGILMGHIAFNYQNFQVTDTPGLLKRCDEQPYDSIPNFSAADALRLTGI